MNNRDKGLENENKAVEYLDSLKIKVLESNFNFRQGEIDIVALDNDILCFIEVKYRKTGNSGYPEEAITYSKQVKICKGARYFLYMHKEYIHCQIRFDVIAIDDHDIRYYRDAFSYIGDY